MRRTTRSAASSSSATAGRTSVPNRRSRKCGRGRARTAFRYSRCIVGEDRQPVSIRIIDLQTPEQTPPDEKFVVRAEIDGEGLPDQDAKVFLDIYKPEDEKPTHTLETTVRFQPGEPPHAQVEFTIDPEQLPAELKSEATGRKELIEGEWKFVVRVPKDKRELFAGKEHVSDPATVSIIKKPLRVLLVASGPMKDYQFVRTLFVREKDAKRAELSIFLQNEGRDGRAVQDVEPDAIAEPLPVHAQGRGRPDREAGGPLLQPGPLRRDHLLRPGLVGVHGRPVAAVAEMGRPAGRRADPDRRADQHVPTGPRRRLRPAQAADRPVPGPARRRRAAERAAPPARPSSRGGSASPAPTRTWNSSSSTTNRRPRWPAGRSSSTGPTRRAEGGTPKRGFYNVYPIKSVKPGATVVATFGDPAAKLDGKDHPWLVTEQFGKGRVVFVGSSELWRLRGYKEVYFERFWTKLARYAAAGGRTRQNRRGVLVMGRQFTAGQYVRIEAQLFGPSLEPLAKTTKPKLMIQPAEGGERREVEMAAKPSQGEWTGWFQGRFLAPKAGDYKLELPIPSSADVLRGKFAVKESNPELDNTRPDPAAMAAMAGDLDEVKGRAPGRRIRGAAAAAAGPRRRPAG